MLILKISLARDQRRAFADTWLQLVSFWKPFQGQALKATFYANLNQMMIKFSLDIDHRMIAIDNVAMDRVLLLIENDQKVQFPSDLNTFKVL